MSQGKRQQSSELPPVVISGDPVAVTDKWQVFLKVNEDYEEKGCSRWKFSSAAS